MAAHVGVDDYALVRVPQEQRYSWWSVAVQRFGQVSALSQFLLGSTVGFGMGFWDAFWAFTLGAVVLELVCIGVGIIGCREGLQTSVLTRWTGFGHGGSAVVGVAIGISLIGWFGIQSGVSAEGLLSLIGVLPAWAWSLLFGLAVTLIVLWGFASMKWVAYVTVPAFIVLVAWSVGSELFGHDVGTLVASPPPGPSMSLLEGTTLVAGGFLPETAPTWVPATLVIWVLAALVGQFVAWGLPSINSLIAAFLLYVLAGKLALVWGVGLSQTAEGTELPTAHREVV